MRLTSRGNERARFEYFDSTLPAVVSRRVVGGVGVVGVGQWGALSRRVTSRGAYGYIICQFAARCSTLLVLDVAASGDVNSRLYARHTWQRCQHVSVEEHLVLSSQHSQYAFSTQ